MIGGGRKNADAALIVALASGTTREAAGVGVATVYRRLEDPGFRRQVDEARAEMIARAVGQLADASAAAVHTLRTLLEFGYPPAVRLGAARSILEIGTKLREAEELERRIAALEAQQEAAAQQAAGGKRWRA